jgi:MFS transporter, FHS family, glucose/mannose:H+ symporter
MMGVSDAASAIDKAPSERQRLALLLVGVGAFLTIGALQSLYGPSFAALQARYGVSVAQVGGVVSAHFGGAFVGVLASGLVLVRLGYRGSLVTAAALIATGTSVVGLAGTWPLALAAAFVAGLGFGQATVAVKLMVARAYDRAATGPLNALNGTYGVGAVLGPALVALATSRLGATPEAGAWVFGTVALGAVAFTLAAVRLRWWPQPRRPQRSVAERPPFGALAFMLLLFLYVAAEVTTPAWIPTHLAGRLGETNAALVASAFWAAITVGRFAVVPLAARLKPRDLVLGASIVGLLGLVLAQVPALAVPGYVLAGLGFAPVFPTTIAWLQWRFGERGERLTPLVLAAGNVGPVIGAPAVGVVVMASSPASIPTVLAGVAALLVASVAFTWWRGRRAERIAA